jgi:SAM-dependent methyltransferase
MKSMASVPSSTPARLQTQTLSPAERGLLETFISSGSRCLYVSRTHGVAVQPWLLGHGCSHVRVDALEATALPYEDESFDATLLIGVLDKLVEPDLAATELRRVLRPGGVLLATAPNVSYWRHRLGRVMCANQPGGVSPSSLRRLLLQGGFSVVGVEGQDGAFIRELPLAGRLWKGNGSGPYRFAERLFPSLLGLQVGAFAIRV